MKNKLVSVLLVVAMLLSVILTGCSAEKTADEVTEDLEGAASKSATTLVMWCVTEEGTDPEQAQAVAKAMAEMTKSKYKDNSKAGKEFGWHRCSCRSRLQYPSGRRRRQRRCRGHSRPQP